MDWTVVWSEFALANAEAAVRHLAEHSTRAAEDLRKALFEAVEILPFHPEIGPVYEADGSGLTLHIVCRNYLIFYRPIFNTKTIHVILVWHSARREPDLPP